MRFLISIIISLLVLGAQTLTVLPVTHADSTTYGKGVVMEITNNQAGSEQQVTVNLVGKDPRNPSLVINEGNYGGSHSPRYTVGDTVIIVRQALDDGTVSYAIADQYRLPSLILLVVILFALVGFVGLRYGIGSILGLSISIGVIGGGMLPALIAGHSPLLVATAGILVITLGTFYPTHGFTRETTLAVIATLLTTLGAFGLAYLVTWLTGLTGLGSEEALLLSANGPVELNLHGIFLVGIILGALGALNDTTIAQVAVTTEIAKANPRLTYAELFSRAMRVGRQHIASMINTLVLAYAGAALPLMLMVALNGDPLWVVLSNSAIAEEIVRTIVGSLAIVAAIPLTTLLATWQAEKLR